MELKEIKTRYEAKCNKCNRDIRVGWIVYYDASAKVVYCKPCAEILLLRKPEQNGSSQGADSDTELLLNELAGNIKLHNDMMGQFSLSLKAINESLAEILKLLKPKSKEK